MKSSKESAKVLIFLGTEEGGYSNMGKLFKNERKYRNP